MPKSLLPPRGVFVPTIILYDKSLPPAVRDTWIQLRGLAWGQAETPPISIKTLSEILEKSQSTIYEHMRLLRIRGALRWHPAGSTEIRVVFPDDKDLSENLEMLDPSFTTSDPQPDKQIKKRILKLSENLENQKIPREVLKEMVSTLAGVYMVDMSMNFPRLAKEAKTLITAGYYAEQVQQLYFPSTNGNRSAWYEHDWRGKKGQPPAMGQIPQTITLLLDPPQVGEKGKRPKHNDDFRRYDKGKYAEFIDNNQEYEEEDDENN